MDAEFVAALGAGIGCTALLLAFYVPLKRLWETRDHVGAVLGVWIGLTVAYGLYSVVLPWLAYRVTGDPFVVLTFPEGSAFVAAAMCGWIPGAGAALVATAVFELIKGHRQYSKP